MDTDIEDLLREGMERFTADLRAPAGLTRRAARRRRRRRRRLALRSVAGVVTALAAVAVALAAGVPGAGRNGTDATAYVVKRAVSALSAAEPAAIAQMTVTTSAAVPGGQTVTATAEEWSYSGQWRSVTNSPAGHPVYDEGFSTASVYTLVSYRTRTWARQHELGVPAAPTPAPISSPRGCETVVTVVPSLFRYGLLPVIGLSASSRPATVATALRAAVSCGTLAMAGRQRVDGTEAIELTSRPGSMISETVWVSPGTYLPVRVVIRSASGQPVLRQTANITWLLPTAQNLARLTVLIPSGFRQAPLANVVRPNSSQIPGGLAKPTVHCPDPAGLVCKVGNNVFRLQPRAR